MKKISFALVALSLLALWLLFGGKQGASVESGESRTSTQTGEGPSDEERNNVGFSRESISQESSGFTSERTSREEFNRVSEEKFRRLRKDSLDLIQKNGNQLQVASLPREKWIAFYENRFRLEGFDPREVEIAMRYMGEAQPHLEINLDYTKLKEAREKIIISLGREDNIEEKLWRVFDLNNYRVSEYFDHFRYRNPDASHCLAMTAEVLEKTLLKIQGDDGPLRWEAYEEAIEKMGSLPDPECDQIKNRNITSITYITKRNR